MNDRGEVSFKGILVKPLAEQHDRQGPRIDPAGVDFAADADYSIVVETEYGKVVGWGRVSRAEDGTLWVEGSANAPLLWGEDIQPMLSIGVETTLPDLGDGVISDSKLKLIQLTREHTDLDQPPITVIRRP